MTQQTETMGCTVRCWAVAALAGALCAILLLVLGGEWGLMQVLFVGTLVTLAAGLLLTFVACRPLPAPGTVKPGATAAATSAPEKTATATTAAAPAATAVPAQAAPAKPVETHTTAAADAKASAPKADKPKKPAAAASKSADADTSKNARKPVAADGKPELLKKARDGGPDDLKMIKGVGPKMEGMLHDMGIYHFDQVASWRKKEVEWVDDNLEGFNGRVARDEWVKQAKLLAKGGTTEFANKVKKGDVY